MASTYYSILNISTSATQRDIKVAYRKLVQQHHPDVNASGNDELIKQINVAYETLSNLDKKTIYDRSLLRNFSQVTSTTSYNQPTYRARPPRRPPPHSYQNRTSETTYTYSTKTKLQMWVAIVLTFALIYFGIRGMNIFTSYYYYEKAERAIEKKEYNSAFKLYELSIRKWGPKNVEASIKIAGFNLEMEDYYLMIENCKRAFLYNPDTIESAELLFLEGIGYSNTDQFKEAEWAFNKSLNYHYNKDSIYQQLGPIYLNHLKKYRDAEHIFTYLLLDEYNNKSDYYNRGLCLQLQGKHAEALIDFQIILNEDPNNGKIIFQLGRSYLAMGQKEKGCEHLRFAQQQGIKIDPKEYALICQ